MIATSIPVGAVKARGVATRPLPMGYVPTQVRRVRRNPVWAPGAIVGLVSAIATIIGAGAHVGVQISQSIQAKKNTLEGLRKQINTKKEALDSAKNETKRRRLRDEIAALELRADALEAELRLVVEAGQQQPPPVASGTPLWQWGLVGLTAVVVIGGGGYLVLGARRRRRSS